MQIRIQQPYKAHNEKFLSHIFFFLRREHRRYGRQLRAKPGIGQE